MQVAAHAVSLRRVREAPDSRTDYCCTWLIIIDVREVKFNAKGKVAEQQITVRLKRKGLARCNDHHLTLPNFCRGSTLFHTTQYGIKKIIGVFK